MRRPESIVLVLVLASSATALADEESTPVEAPADPDAVTTERAVGPAQPLIPPGIDYPGIVDLGPRMSLYIDHTYEYANDLSTFWWVQGRGNNYRVALGGSVLRVPTSRGERPGHRRDSKRGSAAGVQREYPWRTTC